MSVAVRPYKRGGWEVDIRFRWPDGIPFREKVKSTVTGKTAAQRWGEARERHLLLNGRPKKRKEAPTLEDFAPRFIAGHAVANQQKPSAVAASQTILDVHLIPALGTKRLGAITNEDIQHLKHKLQGKAGKTVNNVLSVLSLLLKKAVEWEVLERVPCVIRLVKAPKPTMTFWDFDAYEKLVESARGCDTNTYLIALLGGEAGLRCGEIIALEWRDIDFTNGHLCVERSEWRGHITAPKGGRFRMIPMRTRLRAALTEHRHTRSRRVVCEGDGTPMSQDMVGNRVRRAAKAAVLEVSGAHRLRHTFCSHLALRGVPVTVIQQLAGHQDIKTTLRYMHLNPGARESAIRLMEMPTSPR